MKNGWHVEILSVPSPFGCFLQLTEENYHKFRFLYSGFRDFLSNILLRGKAVQTLFSLQKIIRKCWLVVRVIFWILLRGFIRWLRLLCCFETRDLAVTVFSTFPFTHCSLCNPYSKTASCSRLSALIPNLTIPYRCLYLTLCFKNCQFSQY